MNRILLYDKDGTLLNFHKLWTPYAKKCIDEFAEDFDAQNIKSEVAGKLGYIDGEIKANSTIASGTGSDIHKVFESFREGGGEWAKEFYESNLQMLADDMVLIDGVKTVLEHGLTNGYKNVIVTSDSRDSTLRFIEKFELEPYIFDVICGDDNDYHKPQFGFIKDFIDKHEYPIEELVMIGDNAADTLLGYDEGLYTIGVLSGTGQREHLAGADRIVDSIKDLYDADGKFILDA
ncbi:haloacid dehalogenase [Jeotgalicoccus coquinae]|uniref:Phosphoglycolate phosphatase-like HAD superfamily hydrolase n=1 Tax=Jeotgalicoccus coquinae TaxID=709509 RepID=A0A6V7RRF7_9STAP|nr:HAD family hydrolase [Jeotgalicoccus coquinae]MBB6423881.1 phosphoglycolate phosphatase-like HAD superfamily hydrolase [Jeotgalicoccus coquinae]GGE24263.1 haloacid dehalogenase [Jeotgalicoccus coquinae]CAD2080616.1 Pyrophosphatase PpaX [Jeotgalicoccus coquinae]